MVTLYAPSWEKQWVPEDLDIDVSAWQEAWEEYIYKKLGVSTDG